MGDSPKPPEGQPQVLEDQAAINLRLAGDKLKRELDDARIYARAANDTERWGSEIIVRISKLRVI